MGKNLHLVDCATMCAKSEVMLTKVVSLGHFDNFCCWQFGEDSSAHRDGIDVRIHQIASPISSTKFFLTNICFVTSKKGNKFTNLRIYSASKRPESLLEPFNLFVTSKNETTNSPILEFKVLRKGQRAFKHLFLWCSISFLLL